MKKNFKRALSIMLVLIMTLSSGPIYTFALDEDMFSYETTDDGKGIIITECFSFVEGDITIPSEINGKPVVEIAEGAFISCINLTSIVLPDSIVTIGGFAFSGCESLELIVIGENAVNLGEDIFYGCTNKLNVRCVSGSAIHTYCVANGIAVEGEITGLNIQIMSSLPIVSGNALVFKIKSSINVTKLRLEDGKYIVNEWADQKYYTDSDNVRTWTISQIINTIGENRRLYFRAGNSAGYENSVYQTPAFSCKENEQKLPVTTIIEPESSDPFVQGDEQHLIWTVDGVPGNGLVPDYFIINVFKDNKLVFAERNFPAEGHLDAEGKFYYRLDGGYFEEIGDYEISVTSVKEGYQYSDDEVIISINQRFLPETNVIYPTSKSQIYENEVSYVHWTVGDVTPESDNHPDSFTITVTNPSGSKTEYTKAFSDWSDGYGYDYDEGFFYFTIPGDVFAKYGDYSIAVTSTKEGYLHSSGSAKLKVLCPHLNKTTDEKKEEYPEYFDKYGHRFYKTTRTICGDCDQVLNETKEYSSPTIHSYEYEDILCKCGLYGKSDSVTYPDARLKEGCSGTLYWDAGKTVDNKSIISSSDPLKILGEAADYYFVEYWSDTIGAYKARFINSEYVSVEKSDIPLSIEIIDKDSEYTQYAVVGGEEIYPYCPDAIGYYTNGDFSLNSFYFYFLIENIGKYGLLNPKLTVTLSTGLSFDGSYDVSQKNISVSNADHNNIYKSSVYVSNKNSNGYYITVSLCADNMQDTIVKSHKINLIEINCNSNSFNFDFTKDKFSFINYSPHFDNRLEITNEDLYKLIKPVDTTVQRFIKSFYNYDRNKKIWRMKGDFKGACYGISSIQVLNYNAPDRLNIRSNFSVDNLYCMKYPKNSDEVMSFIAYYSDMQKLPDPLTSLRNKRVNGAFSLLYWNDIITTISQKRNTPILATIPGHAIVFLGIEKIDEKFIYIKVCDPNSDKPKTLLLFKETPCFRYNDTNYYSYELQLFDTVEILDNNNYFGIDNNVKLKKYPFYIAQIYGVNEISVSEGTNQMTLNNENAVYDLFDVDSNNSTKWYLSKDMFKNLAVDFDAKNDVIFKFVHQDYYYEISADSGSHIEMLDSGKITFVPKNSGEFEMSITTSNEKTELPWYTTTVCGTSGDNISLSTKASEGVLFEGITEGPLQVVVSNDNGDIAIEFETDAESVLVSTQGDNTLQILADTDNDGEYESEIPYETVSVESVSLSCDILEIERTGTSYVYANVEPYYASNPAVKFVSSDPSVATVDENGLVTAVSCGTCIVSVITEDGNHMDECVITVIPKSRTIQWIIDGEVTEATLKEGEAIIPPTDPVKDGYKFVGWTPEVPETMPDYDLTFTAVFEPIEKPFDATCPDCGKTFTDETEYNNHVSIHKPINVIINGGKIKEGVALPGATLIIEADLVDGKVFSHWSVEGATVEDANRSVTTLVLGTDNVTVTAEYDDCECKCHQGGIAGFFFKIVLFFQKLFGKNLECFCGKKH